MNGWISFSLYVAAGVLIEASQTPEAGPQSLNDLEFLVNTLQTMGPQYTVSKSFLTQLKIELEAAGISTRAGSGKDVSGMDYLL